MRIISGIYKGRKIKALTNANTRPTIDRVREAWASTLVSLLATDDFSGLKVLDAFAGSGALGLELLSRGAGSCLFLENDKQAFAVLTENVQSLGLTPARAQLLLCDTLSPRLLEKLRGRAAFTLLCLDPPYKLNQSEIAQFLIALAENALIAQTTLISYEHHEGDPDDMDGLILTRDPDSLALKLVRHKKYGTIVLDYYQVCQKTAKDPC